MKQISKKFNKIQKLEASAMNNIAYKILVEPIITEAASLAIELNKYTFKVTAEANKIQIRKAIEELYKVKVIAVNTSTRKRRSVSYGKTPGFKSEVKKAIVTLKEGDSIELFNGA
jgi:large subunit ribosomal protein L23